MRTIRTSGGRRSPVQSVSADAAHSTALSKRRIVPTSFIAGKNIAVILFLRWCVQLLATRSTGKTKRYGRSINAAISRQWDAPIEDNSSDVCSGRAIATYYLRNLMASSGFDFELQPWRYAANPYKERTCGVRRNRLTPQVKIVTSSGLGLPRAESNSIRCAQK